MKRFSPEFKTQVHHSFIALLDTKINALQQNLKALQESGANETKSTAGDKHETALAMLQIEQANNRTQLQKLLTQKTILDSIDIVAPRPHITFGSIVLTNKGVFYISVALGKISIDEHTVFAISVDAPMGIQLLGKVLNDVITINEIKYTVIEFL